MTITERDLLGIVGKIYAAPMQPDGWVTALDSITALFGASGATYSGTLSNAAITAKPRISSSSQSGSSMLVVMADPCKSHPQGKYLFHEY